MEINWLVVLAVLWALLNLLGKLKKEPQEKPPQARPPRPPQGRRLPEALGTPDATQREGSRLELVLREFERALEQAGPLDSTSTMPESEEIEDRESLERDPEVVSLETEVRREPRKRVDWDEGAEQTEARRVTAAAARDRAISKSDHTEFDKRIRQEPSDKTATTGYTAQQLRDAVVWREILGPPVSLRDER